MRSHIELLEPRTLLSGWTTVDDYQLVPGVTAVYQALTSDATGNLYAVGRAGDGNAYHFIVREKAQGATTWNTTTDINPNPLGAIVDAEVSAAGDLYVASSSIGGVGWMVARRAAGQSGFTVVDQFDGGQLTDLTIDASGNVFAVGDLAVTTTVKKTQTTTYTWIVRKQTGGTGAFATVDSYRYAGTESTVAHGVTSIAVGSAAGLYVVGSGGNQSTAPVYRHLVRKSTDGGLTWSLVDDFAYQTGQWAVADVVTGVVTQDGMGNLQSSVYVGGKALTSSGKGNNFIRSTYWTVRKSSTGAAGSWSLDNAVALGSSWSNEPSAIQADSAGNVFVAGRRIDESSGYDHSMVRSNRGGSWQTEDDFVVAPGGTGFAAGLARDAVGNIFVAGYGSDSQSPHAFIRSPGVTQSGQVFSGASIGSGTSGQDPLGDLLGSDSDVLT